MSDVPARVHYFDEQYLRRQDFVAEQDYHLAVHRRHNIAQHRWGIVTGLELVAEEGMAWIQPGVAIDAFGRELVLPYRRPVALSAFADKGSDTLDVWLMYDRIGAEAAPPGYTGCDASGSESFYRWQEQPLVVLQAPDPSFPDRRRPAGVAAADLEHRPWLQAPDDPARFFPVFLGQLTRPPAAGAAPTIDLAGRPYVGLVGEGVIAPSGRVAVQIGARDEADENRFAVYVSDPSVPRLALRQDGTASVAGHTTIAGDLTLRGGAAEFQPGDDDGGGGVPWRIYHVQDETSDVHELRIQMARASGEAAEPNEVVIGSWRKGADGAEAFQPCLTVTDAGTVTVHGNLVVTGQVFENVRTTPELSEQARQAINAMLMSGIGGAGTLIDRVFRGPFPPGNVD